MSSLIGCVKSLKQNYNYGYRMILCDGDKRLAPMNSGELVKYDYISLTKLLLNEKYFYYCNLTVR